MKVRRTAFVGSDQTVRISRPVRRQRRVVETVHPAKTLLLWNGTSCLEVFVELLDSDPLDVLDEVVCVSEEVHHPVEDVISTRDVDGNATCFPPPQHRTCVSSCDSETLEILWRKQGREELPEAVRLLAVVFAAGVFQHLCQLECAVFCAAHEMVSRWTLPVGTSVADVEPLGLEARSRACHRDVSTTHCVLTDCTVKCHGCVHRISISEHIPQSNFSDVAKIVQMHCCTLLFGVRTCQSFFGRHS